ncbi:MAG: hypothetical protein HW383_132 [Candidatus Magasanikbacteria bacterium]|nr:hypothetical protein [Candidatus Magasanikbacteria bacterium]
MREGLKSNRPFVITKDALSSHFKVLSTAEVAKLGGPEKHKQPEFKRGEKLTMEQAETIIGRENFFGPEAVEKAFGIRLAREQIPEIPFLKVDLERAKELGQFLVLRADKAPDGQPLTMRKMHELLQADFSQAGKGKVLYDTKEGWKIKSEFFTTETPQATWALSSRTLISDSKSKNYVEQTQALIQYLTEEVFKDQDLPPQYQAAINEFQTYYDRNFQGKTPEQIKQLLDSEWERYAKELSELQLNELTRQSPADALYDMLIHFQNTGTKILETDYTWTKRRSSNGRLVDVGDFDAGGAGVFDRPPDSSYGNLGVSFSRSH